MIVLHFETTSRPDVDRTVVCKKIDRITTLGTGHDYGK